MTKEKKNKHKLVKHHVHTTVQSKEKNNDINSDNKKDHKEELPSDLKTKIIFLQWKKFFLREIIKSSRVARIVIYSVVIMICCGIFGVGYYVGSVQDIQNQKEQSEAERMQRIAAFDNTHMQEISAVQDLVMTDTWKEFKSQWYGFVIKYPADWVVRVVPATQEKNKAVYRVGFYKPQENGSMPDVVNGYEVAVYDLKKVPEFSLTDEYPVKRTNVPTDMSCETIDGHLYETGDYPAEEVYIPDGDQCFEPALFYSNVVGQYIYTIAPIVDGGEIMHDPMVAATDRVPEFFTAASQFANIDIVRPKPKPVAPRVNAPVPATYMRDALGRMVCEKKNDKPGKSKENNKGKMHMDMECCLDPDEYPNPHCYYDPGKYGKYYEQ